MSEVLATDARRLIGWKIPDAWQRYTRRDVALYALSVGAGRDPLATQEHHLVDPWSERLAVLPTMPLVLGYPGFWLGAPEVYEASGISPQNVLHAEQAVEIHAPLPVEAEVVGKTHVRAVTDKGTGKGALLHSERRIYDRRGMLLATCRQTHFLRGAGGCGTEGEAPANSLRRTPPTGDPTRSFVQATQPNQALLYRLNGDANRLHIDPAFAAQSGFSRPILHGMCTAGIALFAAVNELADCNPSCITALSLRMTAPVLPGDTLSTEFWNGGSFRTRAIERDLIVLDGGQVTVLS